MDLRKYTLNDFKNNISIIEYMKFREDLGFKFKREGKYVKAYIPVTDENNNVQHLDSKPLKKENIIIVRNEIKDKNGISKKSERFFHVNNFNKSEALSIVDFIHQFVFRKSPSTKINFTEVIGAMKQYMEHEKYVSIDNSSVDLISSINGGSKPYKKKKIDFQFPTPNTLNYLKSRGINSDTYLSPQFIGTYGTHNNESKGLTDRPSFSLQNEEGKLHTLQWINFVKGKKENIIIERKNEIEDIGYKFFLKNIPRNSAMYRSNYNKEINCIVLIEAPEKAMAHAQLFANEMQAQKFRPQYMSSCGNITSNDLDVVRRHAAEKKIPNFLLCFDNDLAGYNYTMSVLLELNAVPTKFKITPQSNSKISIEFDNSAKSFLNKCNIPFKTQNNKAIVEGNPESLFKNMQSPEVKIQMSITSDFLDDMNANKKLPYQFKSNSKNHTL